MKIRNTLVLDFCEPLSKAAQEVVQGNGVIITKDGKYYGTIDRHSLLHGIKEPEKVKCETVALKPPVLYEQATIDEKAHAFLLGHFRALPILDENDKPVGMVSRVDVIAEAYQANKLPATNAAELMNAPVYLVSENENLGKAKTMMKERKVHKLIVIGKIGGYPKGILWAEDIAASAIKSNLRSGRMNRGISQNIKIDEMQVGEFIRPDITTVEQQANMDQIAEKMLRNQVSEVVVVSNRKPVGVISALDIFKLFNRKKQGELISVSGLPPNAEVDHHEIEVKVKHATERFEKTFQVRNISVHVKERKSNYIVNLYLETNRGHISIKEENPSLKDAIDTIASELNIILRKRKDMKKTKPRMTKRGEEGE